MARPGGGLLGLAAGALTVGVATALAAGTGALGLTSPAAAPVVATGGFAVDRVPLWLKNLAVQLFGTADKAVLVTGILLVLAAASAGLGVLAVSGARGRRAALGGFALLGLVGALVVLSRPDHRLVDVIPLVMGVALGATLLDRGAEVAGTRSGTGPDRRTVLAGAGGVVLGVATGIQWRGGTSGGSASLPAIPDVPAPSMSGVNPGVPGQSPYIVPASEFYRIDTALLVPGVDAASWQLRVTGMVDREVTIDYPTLLAKPLVDAIVTLTCVSNEVGGDLIDNAVWTGWPVRELLAMAGPQPDADMVLSTSVDGWSAGTPLGAMTDGRFALLAVAMNGKPLPADHGYPVRLVVPGLYGYVSATKWVTELKVTRFDRDEGYWTPRGWSALGPVKTASRIDVPRDGSDVSRGANGLVAVAGVAWAQHRGIDGVEVQVDDGPWVAATLAAEPTVDAWRQWVYRWPATPGRHRLTVRATDGTGAVQTAQVSPPAPNGATGYHSVTVTVA